MVRELFRFSFKFIYCAMKTTYLIAPSIKAIESETEKNKDKVLLSMTGVWYRVCCVLMCIVLAAKWREMQLDISDQTHCASV